MSEPIRNTRQRRAVVEVLNEIDAFTSAQNLHDELKKRGESIGLSTVYRNLQALADLDQVDVLLNDEGEALYRACSEGHHHHLVCRECGRTVEVNGPGVESWTNKIAAEHGFTDVAHTLELFGLCADCSR